MRYAVSFIGLLIGIMSANAKPVIDFVDCNITDFPLTYERPDFILNTGPRQSDICVVTDQRLTEVDRLRAEGYTTIIAYLLDSVEIYRSIYDWAARNRHKFDLILTHERTLLDAYPDKCKFIHAIGWGPLKNEGIHPKSKMVSIMTGKNWTFGHRLRLEVLNRYRPYFDGIKTYDEPFAPYKDPWLVDFRYAMIIENDRRDYWFTEKLIDAFRSGTVPIFWGCPSIGQFFDVRGMIIWEDINELETILPTLSEADYLSRMPYIISNFQKAALYPTHKGAWDINLPESLDCLWPYLQQYIH